MVTERGSVVQMPRRGIVIDLNELRRLITLYLAERGGTDNLLPTLLLSDFLVWTQQRQRQDDAESNQRR